MAILTSAAISITTFTLNTITKSKIKAIIKFVLNTEL